jgi:pyridoxal phosphate enzyme (YggS family)
MKKRTPVQQDMKYMQISRDSLREHGAFRYSDVAMGMDGKDSGMDMGHSVSPATPAEGRIAERIKRVQASIAQACSRAGRDASELKLVIVTKSATIEEIRQVLELGFQDLGENHVQQLRKVWAQMAEPSHQGEWASLDRIRWHMIGHLQRNKVRHVLAKVVLIHSVDTLRLAEEINNDAARLGIKSHILLQVNTSNEPQKYGVPVGAATHLAEQIETLPYVELDGLMTMAPLTLNKDVVRECFARAHELFTEMRGEKIVGPHFTELSMGMSSDYEVAIEEGATILRIGSAVFAG